jgi:hypothetical protein
VATTVPAGTVIKVISASAREEPMVEVLIEGRRMLMFAIDVNERGQEIMDHPSNFNLFNA